MKTTLIAAALAVSCLAAAADDHYVPGYTRADGTYVAGHMQTNPNSTPMDNYSTRGNINPYTGQAGTVNPYATPRIAPTPIMPTQPVIRPTQPYKY